MRRLGRSVALCVGMAVAVVVVLGLLATGLLATGVIRLPGVG